MSNATRATAIQHSSVPSLDVLEPLVEMTGTGRKEWMEANQGPNSGLVAGHYRHSWRVIHLALRRRAGPRGEAGSVDWSRSPSAVGGRPGTLLQRQGNGRSSFHVAFERCVRTDLRQAG